MTMHETDADSAPNEATTPTPTMMRAIVQDRHGPPDVLELGAFHDLAEGDPAGKIAIDANASRS